MQLFLSLFLILSVLSFARQTEKFHSGFINNLIHNRDVSDYVLPEELALSERLGITYDSVKYKFLISYDIDEAIKQKIVKGELSYNIQDETLEDGYSKITLEIPGSSYNRPYFFKDSLLVSPPFYYGKNWKKIESRYFTFFVSSEQLFNQYSIQKLDSFVQKAAEILKYKPEELKVLEEKKIFYFLCRDEKEVELLTGYQARGNYILAYDYIITTYNCHYHEIVHLLTNYKLKTLPLYTHPFLQEGLATAIGGRGGIEPGVVLSLGSFLEKSGFGSYKSLLAYTEFQGTDASFSYPLSALFTNYLLETNGINYFFELYKNYSGDITKVSSSVIKEDELSPKSFGNYLEELPVNPVQPETINTGRTIIENDFCTVYENEKRYFIKTKNNLLIKPSENQASYKSKIFMDEYKEREYMGEKYLIKVNASDISIYNLYTNILIAQYAAGFSTDMKPVPSENGYFFFSVSKNIFEDELKDLQFIK